MRYQIINDQLIIDQLKVDTDLISQIKSVFPMRLVQPLINQKMVRFNDHVLTTTIMVRSIHDRLIIPLIEPAIPYGYHHDPLKVLYEDALFLIVSKPKGLIIYDPIDLKNPHTLVAMIHGYYQTHGVNGGIYYLHRLDKDTSGIVVCVKHAVFVGMLTDYFTKNHIHRQYTALVKGVVEPKHIVIDQPIGKNRHASNRYLVLPSGKSAKTQIDVIKYGSYHKIPVSVVQATLHTGRTHQIRVHMEYIHHPIINDPYYGSTIDASGLKLHASHIDFIHPLTNDLLSIDDPLDFQLDTIH